MPAKLKGLFLSGGRSQRMGTDKALLRYQAEPEIGRWKAVFEALGLPLYWSLRPGQYETDQYPDIPRIEDAASEGAGPLAALLGAHKRFPKDAWLVLACDWPLLDAADIERLIEARQRQMDATVFMVNEQREPLCTIYEPVFLARAAQAFGAGEVSLFRLLTAAAAHELVPHDASRFLNANDAITRQEASQTLLHRNDR